MNLIQASQDHLQKSKMQYLVHLYHAFSLGFVLIYAGIASIIHALLPCFFAAYSANKVTWIFYKVIYRSANPDIQAYREKEAIQANRQSQDSK